MADKPSPTNPPITSQPSPSVQSVPPAISQQSPQQDTLAQSEVHVAVSSSEPEQPSITVTTEEQSEEENTWMNPLLIGLGICGGLLLLALGWLIFFYKATPRQVISSQIVTQLITPTPLPAKVYTTMSGIVSFQGYAPQGSYIAISERGNAQESFKDVVSGLVPNNGIIPWTWNSATQGHNYEIIAVLKESGRIIQESSITSVSAPANNVTIPIVSTQQPPQPQQVTISGTIHLDGYLPSGSTFSVLSSPTGKGNFAPVVSNLSAQDGTNWSWTTASSGQTYDINVRIYDGSGNRISTDNPQTVTAPSTGLVFYVSSNAQPPVPVVTGISGTISINGSIPSNSYITLATRPASSTGSFNQIANNIASTNGVNWSWSGAQSGTQYDVQAYLWVNNQPYSQTNILTITAPSQNNVLTMNTQQTLGAPAGNTISVTCNGQSNNAYQATINYNTQTNLNNPVSYNIVVTLASQGSQVMNTTVSPGNPTQSQALTTTYIFTPGSTYYAQYAYSTSPNSNSFSPLSPAVQFSCQ